MKAEIYSAPLGNLGICVVDIRDIAEATAIVLTSEEHNSKTYNLNGPEAVSGEGGIDLEQIARPRDSLLGSRHGCVRGAGGFVAETGDVEKLTKLLGRAPCRYEDFAAEAVALWKQ
ncbi:MAG TPA: hypothetical protein VMU26_12120 [Candidatus Polarisedimenticolia bacterium]|nr:hypothetical protein [Candidatus Polarisedimenticolia bacterium]